MKILVTGGTGMVGSAFKSAETEHDLVFFGSNQYDLLSSVETCRMIESCEPDAIIHLAARVGGVKGNSDFVADFFYENIVMNTNLLNSAKEHGIFKVVSLLSTCIYPDNVKYPLTENQIHDGEPHSSNFGYAYAKRMLDAHSRAIRKQYGLGYITAVPNNLYGENDNFDLDNGHVIPALIRKFYEAKISNTRSVVLWGSGRPLREFTFSRDVAQIILWLVENYNEAEPINIGNTEEISIRELAVKIKNIVGYKGEIVWDAKKPEGQFRKPSSNSRLKTAGWKGKYTPLEDGLRDTVEYFEKYYPNLRGIN